MENALCVNFLDSWFFSGGSRRVKGCPLIFSIRYNSSAKMNPLRKSCFLLTVVAVVIGAAFSLFEGARAQAGTAADLIRAVNELRASLGAAPLQANNALNAAAQAHAEYLASLGYLTHTGLGGSRPLDRAIAAGYGGQAGGTVLVAENLAVGRDLAPEYAVNTVWADEEQRNNLTNARYTDVGAGVAVVDGMVYYVVNVGYVAIPVTASPTPTDPATIGPATHTPAASQTNTPQPDGSIIHEVQPGESLWSIAIAYNIKIEDIRQYNGLGSSDIVWAGQKLFVAPTYTPTPIPTVTDTPVPPTATPRPTLTPRPPTLAPSPTVAPPTPTPTRQPLLPGLAPGSDIRRYLGIGMIIICGLGLVILLLNGLKR